MVAMKGDHRKSLGKPLLADLFFFFNLHAKWDLT